MRAGGSLPPDSLTKSPKIDSKSQPENLTNNLPEIGSKKSPMVEARNARAVVAPPKVALFCFQFLLDLFVDFCVFFKCFFGSLFWYFSWGRRVRGGGSPPGCQTSFLWRPFGAQNAHRRGGREAPAKIANKRQEW